MRRLVRSVWNLVQRHGPEALGGLIAAGGVVLFQSPLGALVRFPLSIVREEWGRRGRRKRRERALASVAASAAEFVDRPLLTRGRPELHFWRPNWTVSVRTLAAEGFGGLPGFDETWKTLYAAIAEDLAELQRAFSSVAFSGMPDLEESDRKVTQQVLSRLNSAVVRALEMSGASAESGFHFAAKAENPLAAHDEAEPFMARHRELYPLWREDLKTAVEAADQLGELAREGRPMAVAIIGWGSLCYDWHGLSLVEPVRWRPGGPHLPIEFSRRSKKGERAGLLTAVIDTNCPKTVPTLVSASRLHNVAEVRAELRVREGDTFLRWTAAVDRAGNRQGDCPDSAATTIHQWLQESDYDAAVWTAIPPDFGDETFSVPAAVEYFRSLGRNDPKRQQEARNYIVWAPDEVDTPLRRALRDAGLLAGADPRPIDIVAVWTR